ncbi:MAG TPA: hypothetical protein VH308_11335 [Terracidiphilus sp.]|nr:hypothetical protein [Terracidiphilus sp.]
MREIGDFRWWRKLVAWTPQGQPGQKAGATDARLLAALFLRQLQSR